VRCVLVPQQTNLSMPDRKHDDTEGLVGHTPAKGACSRIAAGLMCPRCFSLPNYTDSEELPFVVVRCRPPLSEPDAFLSTPHWPSLENRPDVLTPPSPFCIEIVACKDIVNPVIKPRCIIAEKHSQYFVALSAEAV
jgi:hypothetical protein